MDAERQRDQAEQELATVRRTLRDVVTRIDVSLFAASVPEVPEASSLDHALVDDSLPESLTEAPASAWAPAVP
jgi:hypothetical protein